VILEGKMLIEKVATNASKEVIRCRRNPITQVEDIVEYKHDSSTHDGINDTHHDKLHESLICKQTYLIF
jgi:hypothetical protein